MFGIGLCCSHFLAPHQGCHFGARPDPCLPQFSSQLYAGYRACFSLARLCIPRELWTYVRMSLSLWGSCKRHVCPKYIVHRMTRPWFLRLACLDLFAKFWNFAAWIWTCDFHEFPAFRLRSCEGLWRVSSSRPLRPAVLGCRSPCESLDGIFLFD
jgi:hypothetical protein